MGYHLYHFYEDDEKLAQILARFFDEGLRKLEYCIWIPREGISHSRAINLLKKHIPDIEDFLLSEQMDIVPFETWAKNEDGTFDRNRLKNKWMSKYKEVMEKGFIMMRAVSDPSSLAKKHWDEFMDFEATLNDEANDMNLTAVCTYQGKLYKPSEIQTILKHHFCPLTPGP